MEYKILGNTGIKVSPLCFGTMSFGGDADEATSAAMFGRCREAGINFFDCADVYEKGRSEEILGGLIRDCRTDVIIASKVYFPTGQDVNARGSHRQHIRHAIEASLRRLNTDYIDLYFRIALTRRRPWRKPCGHSRTLCVRARFSTRRPAISPRGR